METLAMTSVLTFATLIAIFVTLALETFKKLMEGFNKPVHPSLLPAVAFLIGVAMGAIAYPFTDMELVLRLWAGGVAGWMASGLYDTVKKVAQN